MGQVRDVINGKIVLGAQKEIQEVKNAYAAYERISGMDPYDMRQLKQLHGIMTKYLVEESGENMMRLFPDAMLPVSLQFLLNLCWRR